MKKVKKAMMAAQLNIDVIAEILSRLRVKDLIRFKSVCKSWLELISSKDFIKLHLQRSSFSPIPLENRYFDIDCHRVQSPFPGRSIFCGSSGDGLVCLFNTTESIIHIWNPALHSSACIRVSRSPIVITYFWFGLHDDKYKLVLGTVTLEMHVIRPYVNSFYNWNWKSTRRLSFGYCPNNDIGTLFNGNVHWPVRKYKGSVWVILSYNLNQEKLGEIDVPVDKRLRRSSEREVRLGVVDGCLSALFENYDNDDNRYFDLWVMKDYGSKESWTKLMVFEASTIPLRSINSEVALDDLESIKSPLYAKEVYVESLIYPPTERLGLRSRKKPCQITKIL